MDIRYVKHKLEDAQRSAERVTAFSGEARTFKSLLVAMDAFYFSIEALPEELQAGARRVYDTLNAAMKEQEGEENNG